MSNIAIKVENLSKLYKIGARRSRHDTLRDHIMHGVKSLFTRNGYVSGISGERLRGSGHLSTTSPRLSNEGYIWALKDVSFEIAEGEVVGFIGKNGAGKSTLLKILSRITEPTTGRAKIFGRVGSLLEVGTGFHPELTGRENIYLNGAILGMKRWEIEKKFDEIVAFSEIEKFIDTPVKRYSSGMYVRLAFAVAAHLEPEILIVDEVLSVGDSAFRLKCLDKMQEIREQGRTILLVSHNTDAITRMCGQVFLLDSGRIVQSGAPQTVIPLYLARTHNVTAEKRWEDMRNAPGNEIVRLRSVRACTEDGETVTALDIRLPVGIEAEYEVLQTGHILIPNYHFSNEEGLQVFVVQDINSEWRRQPRPRGRYTSIAWIPGNFLAEGKLTVDVAISSHIPCTAVHFVERKAVGFQVIDSHDGNSARGDYTGPFPGIVRPLVQWSTRLHEKCIRDGDDI
jgi:lipopolysaccharide transport system ATP-binding protein